MKKKLLAGLATGLFIFGSVGMADADLIGPSPYLSFNDSPFKGTNFSFFYLEDFEDHMLNTLGATVDQGTIYYKTENYNFADSVDADDGNIDGSGSDGANISHPSSMTFSFNASILGEFPTHVGLVFTDGTPNNLYTFTAFDKNGISLGSVLAILGDNSFSGTTAEDRFFGAINAGGISRIFITDNDGVNTLAVDHLQYGVAAPVPEPATMLLLGTGIAGLASTRLKRKKQ